MGPVGHFGQIENIKRQSITYIRIAHINCILIVINPLSVCAILPLACLDSNLIKKFGY